jgi:hypothetical protein
MLCESTVLTRGTARLEVWRVRAVVRLRSRRGILGLEVIRGERMSGMGSVSRDETTRRRTTSCRGWR